LKGHLDRAADAAKRGAKIHSKCALSAMLLVKDENRACLKIRVAAANEFAAAPPDYA
jgi:hypothetical protein